MTQSRYRIEDPERGRGGFGRVAKGFDQELERPVAIKTLDPIWAAADEDDRERFRREARILASLRHPNIPSIYDVEFGDKELRIIFEFVEGETLREIINRELPGLHSVQNWFLQIASALEHAHEGGIIHRDIKPANIIVTRGLQHAYLVDFGLALSLRDQRRVSGSGVVVGTAGYMCPEQENAEEAEPSSDVYALGVCLYEGLCGHRIPPGDYEELSIQNETIPPAVDALIANCIAPRHQRINSASEFARRLTRAVHARATLSDVLAAGPLHEVIAALREMDCDDFMRLKVGERLLVLNKALDVVENDDPKIERARLEFLRLLPVLAIHVESDRYRRIAKHALVLGFERLSGKWIGDREIRLTLQDACLRVVANHEVLVADLLAFLEAVEFEEKPRWFFHEVRELLSRLMVNSTCGDKDAEQLDRMLQRVNAM